MMLVDKYHQTVVVLAKLGLVVEHDKTEATHFISSQLRQEHHPLPLRLLRGPFTTSCWRYLGFYLDPALTFRHHISYYVQAARSMI